MECYISNIVKYRSLETMGWGTRWRTRKQLIRMHWIRSLSEGIITIEEPTGQPIPCEANWDDGMSHSTDRDVEKSRFQPFGWLLIDGSSEGADSEYGNISRPPAAWMVEIDW